MSEEFRRFLLRHRVPIGGALVMVVLAVLTVLSLVVRGGASGAPQALTETVQIPERTAPAERARPAPPARNSPPPEPVREPPTPDPEPSLPAQSEPVSRSVPASRPAPAGSGPLLARGPEQDLGELTGVLSTRESTTILGGVALRLEGTRLHWRVRVIENGVTHAGLGLELETLGGSGQYWLTAEAGEHGPGSSFSVGSSEDLPAPLADALRAAAGGIEVEVAGYRVGAGSRLLTASDSLTVPIEVP